MELKSKIEQCKEELAKVNQQKQKLFMMEQQLIGAVRTLQELEKEAEDGGRVPSVSGESV